MPSASNEGQVFKGGGSSGRQLPDRVRQRFLCGGVRPPSDSPTVLGQSIRLADSSRGPAGGVGTWGVRDFQRAPSRNFVHKFHIDFSSLPPELSSRNFAKFHLAIASHRRVRWWRRWRRAGEGGGGAGSSAGPTGVGRHHSRASCESKHVASCLPRARRFADLCNPAAVDFARTAIPLSTP